MRVLRSNQAATKAALERPFQPWGPAFHDVGDGPFQGDDVLVELLGGGGVIAGNTIELDFDAFEVVGAGFGHGLPPGWCVFFLFLSLSGNSGNGIGVLFYG